MPLFEATESTIGFFGLGSSPANVAYLNTFQDYVVSFTGSKSGDLQFIPGLVGNYRLW